jgi:ABC-type multidrug transport system fused ATPase/permease subunit
MIFFIVFAWGAYNLSKGTITYGTMSALMQLFGNIQYPFMGLASSIPKIISTMASVERIMELEELPSDFNNSLLINTNNVGFEFSDVRFSYKPHLPIIDNLSLKVNFGETVAVIGPSGEGKTTLIRLLLSLIYPERGHIFITNNNEKFEVDASCRNLIS